ncbi:hypothetical protein BH11VER1_BH11VER1_19500 [soil metagenome]
MSTEVSPPPSPLSKDDRPQDCTLRILCVEDNHGDYRLLEEQVREASLTIKLCLERATTLADAVSRLEQRKDAPTLDAVLLDLALPDSFGLDTYHRVRRAAPHTAIIILSGNNDRELALEMVEHGAQDYLPKNSLTPDLLSRSILYAVKRQDYRTQMELLNERLRNTTQELLTTQMQLIQMEKLDSLGRIAAGVAHEVKNPLGILQMGVDYFVRRREQLEGENTPLILTNMQEAIIRADTIIREMVDFSRSDQFEMKPCCVNTLVDRALRMVHHEFVRRNIVVVKELTRPLPTVAADQSKLEQVLINILMNSAQAMPFGETLHVRTHCAKVEETQRDKGLRDMNRLRQDDEVVVLEVRDRGPGIAPEIMDRVFEPFFTTKPTGEGTGLGLSVAKKIIELHRGNLQVQNVINPQGLRVRIILKASELQEVSNFPESNPIHRQTIKTQPLASPWTRNAF